MTRSDPIGDKYYEPLRKADTASNYLFWISAGLSLAALLVGKADHPTINDVAQIFFTLSVFALFIISFVIRFYLAPRAEDKRRQDFIANSFSVKLSHDTATGYYNNDQQNPFKRLAASVTENCFFTKSILLDMLKNQRGIVIFYMLAWAFALLHRGTDLGVIAVAAQAVFSEQLLSKWLRMEYLRIRCENIYDRLHETFASKAPFNEESTRALALKNFADYETGKSNACITLSTRIFQKRNPGLSKEWEDIKRVLSL